MSDGTRYQPVTPEQRDAMPADVALELLTNPGKLSARMRKNCMAAREKVYVSKHPIRLFDDGDDEHKHNICWDTYIVPKPAKDRLEQKFLVMRFDRLHRVIKRMDNRIARLRRALDKAERKIVVPWILNSIKNNLESKISSMEIVKQVATNIINHRKDLWKT
jgi:hypothetical protein